MDLFRASERMMRMDDAAWARHANPLSGWSRVAIGPGLIFAIYARSWIGAWCLVPIVALVAFVWINPRLFPAPADHDDWMARGVLGERWFLARHHAAIPRHHEAAAGALTVLSLIGLPVLAAGLWVLDPGLTIAGAVLSILPKLWFIDRMNWIYQDMTGSVPGTPVPVPGLPPKKEETQ